MLDSLIQTISAAILSAGGTGVILYFVLKHAMKPIDAYLETKGKNLATHEDIMKLVDQVRETEKVKAEITDNVWDRQQRWAFKQTLYRELMISLDALYSAVRLENLATNSSGDPASPSQKSEILAARGKVQSCNSQFETSAAFSAIAISAEAFGIVQKVRNRFDYVGNTSAEVNLLKMALDDLYLVTRRDLKYEDQVSTA